MGRPRFPFGKAKTDSASVADEAAPKGAGHDVHANSDGAGSGESSKGVGGEAVLKSPALTRKRPGIFKSPMDRFQKTAIALASD